MTRTAGIIIAVVFVIAAIAFFVMRQPAMAPSNGQTGSAASDPYTDTSTWQTYNNSALGFMISYPNDFDTNEIHAPASTDWRLNAGDTSGQLLYTITIPKAFEPQTNFSEAKLTIGESADTKAVASCLTPDPSGANAAAPQTVTISGTTFTVYSSSDAGAGNLYDTKSYRTVHAGKCYAVEYTIHSTQLANYPESMHLTAFDEVKVQAVLDRIVSTFMFM